MNVTRKPCYMRQQQYIHSRHRPPIGRRCSLSLLLFLPHLVTALQLIPRLPLRRHSYCTASHLRLSDGGGHDFESSPGTAAVAEFLDDEGPTTTSEVSSRSNDDDAYGLTDDEFAAWFTTRLALHPLLKTRYPRILDLAPRAVAAWRERYRGNVPVWRRVFDADRVVKEIVEAAPVLDAALRIVEGAEGEDGKFTIVDLASGRGYLSMVLSELLPPDRVERIVLVDKAWPLCGTEKALPHQINWDHLYGNRPAERGGGTYYETWPIPLHTSKQDLKKKCTHRQLKKVLFERAEGPILILAVHLCGTLSLKAVEMFNDYPDRVRFLALKPCCLPPIVHAQREDVFEVGRHTFNAKEVCSSGRFRGKRWYGPPRWHLERRFQRWSEHLFRGIVIGGVPEGADLGESIVAVRKMAEEDLIRPVFVKEEGGTRAKVWETVQIDGGYQNTFLFAERLPTTPAIWEDYEQSITANSGLQ